MDVTHGQAAHEALRKWLEVERISYSELARRCSSERNKFIAKQITRVVVDGQAPPPQLAGALAEVVGIPAASWHDAPPDSGPRVANLPELTGTPAERLRTLETWLESHARGDGLTTDRHRAVTTLISSLQAQVRAKPIPDLHEHPDWPAVYDLIMRAVARFDGGPKAVIDAIDGLDSASEAA